MAALRSARKAPAPIRGGRSQIRPERPAAAAPPRAAAALQPLASAFDLPIVGAARALIRIAEANMINALKLVTIQRGHDPRDLTMVVSGGGGPLHAAALGRELGVKRVVIPRYAGL